MRQAVGDIAQPSQVRVTRNPPGTPDYLQDTVLGSSGLSDGTLRGPDQMTFDSPGRDAMDIDSQWQDLYHPHPMQSDWRAESISQEDHAYGGMNHQRATYNNDAWWPQPEDPSPSTHSLPVFPSNSFPAQSPTQELPSDSSTSPIDERDRRDSELVSWNSETRDRQPWFPARAPQS